MPESATVCEPAGALSVTVMVPVSGPPAVGVKVTLMAQFAPTATDPPQVLVCAKLALAATVVIASVAEPLLARVTVWAALAVFTS